MPGFTFGLDVILLVGQLRLGEHKTVDEIHHLLMERLAPLSQTISRREILFLFEAYTALLRAGTEVREDQHWREEVLRNGGLLLSLDGIQPDKGNETMYLVRDVLTGRILTAENVTSSTKVMIKQVLAPVVALQLPIIGVISDALESQFNIYLDFFPISRSINVVDISLTNTKDGFPARFGLRQPSKRFQNTRLCWRVS